MKPFVCQSPLANLTWTGHMTTLGQEMEWLQAKSYCSTLGKQLSSLQQCSTGLEMGAQFWKVYQSVPHSCAALAQWKLPAEKFTGGVVYSATKTDRDIDENSCYNVPNSHMYPKGLDSPIWATASLCQTVSTDTSQDHGEKKPISNWHSLASKSGCS